MKEEVGTMALSKEQKDALRTRVAQAVEDPEAVRRAMSYRHIRVSDPQQGYSLRNTLLLLAQWDDRGADVPLTLCAGFHEWLAHGRAVRKGEKGLFITAGWAGDTDEDDDSEGSQRLHIRSVYVYDISQTEEAPPRAAHTALAS
jgi:hypothetical protein